jgi:hypothetical protein
MLTIVPTQSTTTSRTNRYSEILTQTVRFGQNRVSKFFADNNIMAMVRSHEPVQGGWSQSNNVITVFSCTDYCGQNNDAAIIVVKRNEEIAPKVLPNIPGRKEPRWLTLDDGKRPKQPEEQMLRSLNATPPRR